MDYTVVILCALLGAVCMFIITGGAITMSSEEPSSSVLGVGSAVGGGIGAVVAALSSTTEEAVVKSEDAVSSTMDIGTWLMSSGTSPTTSQPEMKVGLPTF
jgi:hypothetical protein